MDPVTNPYAPGAGQRPPELAGRDDQLDTFAVVLRRVAAGRPDRSLVLYSFTGAFSAIFVFAAGVSAVFALLTLRLYDPPLPDGLAAWAALMAVWAPLGGAGYLVERRPKGALETYNKIATRMGVPHATELPPAASGASLREVISPDSIIH